MLEVRAAGYAALVVRPYAVLDRLFQARADTGQQSQAADSTTDMGDVWMEPQVERRFRVVTATGLPADGAELHALSVAGQLLWSDVIATCDSLGIARAVLPTHRDATTTIVATHGDAVGVATLDAPAAEHVIRLGAIADLTVDVVDETGRPLRCHVFAEARCVPSRFGAQHIVSSPLPGRMRSSSQADAGGRAVVTGLPLPAHEGTCRLTVVASDCRGECRDVQLQAGANFVRVAMARGGVATVSGRVVDAETLRPIARAEVGPCRTDDDGTFSIADLDVRYGRVQLTVRANGYVAGAIDEPVGGRAGAITVHAALRPAARITGTILDAAGEPVLGARVSCDGAEAGMSDATGRFTMSVPRGPVTLRVEPPFSPPPTPQPLDVEVDAAAAGSHTIVVGTR
jgi:hypothetical protein